MSSRARRPKSSQSPTGAPSLTDEALLEILLARAPLTAQQTEAFVGYSVQLATGAIPYLPKTVRDHACAVAKANGLLARTQARRAPNRPLGVDGFDPFSTRPGPVDARAAAQLGNIPKPIRRAS